MPYKLRFFIAKAMKQFVMSDGVVEKDAEMFLAKWQGVYVIARNSENFFLVNAKKAPDYVQSVRNAAGKLGRAVNGPVVFPTGPRFQWVVEACVLPTGGCEDEQVTETKVVENKQQAEQLIVEWENSKYSNKSQHFLRIRGPAFYKVKRPEPKPVVKPIKQPKLEQHPAFERLRTALRENPVPTATATRYEPREWAVSTPDSIDWVTEYIARPHDRSWVLNSPVPYALRTRR
jgi:hypothetical protein